MHDLYQKTRRVRYRQTAPRWLWRLGFSTLLGGMALATVVPWAAVQRGYPAIGGEYLLTLAVMILPFCVLRR